MWIASVAADLAREQILLFQQLRRGLDHCLSRRSSQNALPRFGVRSSDDGAEHRSGQFRSNQVHEVFAATNRLPLFRDATAPRTCTTLYRIGSRHAPSTSTRKPRSHSSHPWRSVHSGGANPHVQDRAALGNLAEALRCGIRKLGIWHQSGGFPQAFRATR